MRKTGWIVAAAVAAVVSATPVFAGEAAPAATTTNAVKHQTVCPIEGGKIIRTLYADYDGKRVYFCCNGCPQTFKKNPAKYIKKLEDQGITLDKAEPAKP